MKLLVLASQNRVSADECIVWMMDLVTKQLVKAHIDSSELNSLSIGDCISALIKKHCKRQEVWIEKCEKYDSYNDDELLEILDRKAATPYSIIQPAYVGNICKIESFINVNENEVVVSLYGFPKERKYLDIQDSKWDLYMEHNLYKGDILNALNNSGSRYLIVDFPQKNKKGFIEAAALVVI